MLVSTHAAGMIEVIFQENVAKIHTCRAGNRIMGVYPELSFYITIDRFGKVNVNLPKHQNVGEITNAQEEIVHIKEKRYSYPSGAQACISDSPVSDV